MVNAQSNCPQDPQNYGNQDLIDRCSISELSQLSNQRLITFPSNIITQLSNFRLEQFSNEDLIKIGEASGDLIGFLGKLRNDRLVSFSSSILIQLPTSRIDTFSCQIRAQLNRPCPTPTPTPQPSASPKSPSPQPSPTTFSPQPSATTSASPRGTITVTEIIINDQSMPVQKDSSLRINLHVPNPKTEINIPIRITVKYSDGTITNHVINFHYKPKNIPVVSSFPVDVIIHKNLDQDKTEVWAKDTIDNFINKRFESAGIKQRVYFNQAIKNYDPKNGCPEGGVAKANTCEFNDNNKIRVWINKYGEVGSLGTSANPESAQAWLEIPAFREYQPYSDIDRRALTHEIGHLFKMPDYYMENVYSYNNKMLPNLGIFANAKDIMWSNISQDHFSTTSKGFADNTTVLPAGFGGLNGYNWNIIYTPKNTSFKLTNDDGSPLSTAQVEIFPQTLTNGTLPFTILPDIKTVSGNTNINGEIELGNYERIFKHNYTVPNGRGTFRGNSALVKITFDNQVRYTALTRSQLNSLYFQGQQDSAQIPLTFSQLIAYDPNRTTILTVGDQELQITAEEAKLIEQHILKHLKEDLENQLFDILPTSSPNTTSSPAKNRFDLFGNDSVVNTLDGVRFLQIWREGCTTEIDFDTNNVCNALDYGILKKNLNK